MSRVPEPATAPGGPAVVNAPSVLLPFRFILTGVVAFVIGLVLLALRPDILASYHYNQYVIAATHLFVLGWITTVIMGAMYQLVPVALETKLYSERMARWQFVFHLVGFVGMVWMFWTWNMKQVAHFGSALAVGVLLFVYNLSRTLLRVEKWSVVATAVASSLLWLGLAVTAGLLITAGKCSYESAETLAPSSFWGVVIHGLSNVATLAARFDQIGAMHAHAHLGAVGFFLMMLVGISYKLIPMFTLSELQNVWRARFSLICLNCGLAGGFFAILIRSPLKLGFTFLILGGIILYGFELNAILKARRRKTLDWGVKGFLSGVTALVPVSALAMILSCPNLPLNSFTGQLENLYGFLGLLGVISFAMVGMLHKIVPFLVWFATYSPHIGRSKVPALSDLYSIRLQVVCHWSYVTGLVVCSAGILLSHHLTVRLGAVTLLFSAFALIANLLLMLRHRLSPRISALPEPAKRPGNQAALIPQLSLSK